MKTFPGPEGEDVLLLKMLICSLESMGFDPQPL
jgi:hypothetical protein